MARQAPVSTAVQVKTRPAGTHVVGGGLYLQVNEPSSRQPKGSRQWIFRFTSPETGKRREMGLGSALDGGLSLAEARDKATDLQRMVRSGVDPIAERDRRSVDQALAARQPVTFGKFADKFAEDYCSTLRNAKHAAQWKMTLRVYAAPIRDKVFEEITTEDIRSLLNAIWDEKPETARRTQGRIEKVIDAARVELGLNIDNPARWRGHLQQTALGRKRKAPRHHPAVPYDQLPAFMKDLRAKSGTTARALEFLILTAVRSGNVREADWSEIDLDQGRWTIPGEKMKAGKEHRVPLSKRALEILKIMAEPFTAKGVKPAGLVFPGTGGRPMSLMTMAKLLKSMRDDGATVHGFRSTFRDWAEDVSGFPFGIFKAAMAHAIADKTDRAYRRSDAYNKRAELMQSWEDYAAGTATTATSPAAEATAVATKYLMEDAE